MRRYADAEAVFRLRVTRTLADGSTREEIRGPWPKEATARGQRTALLNGHERGEEQATRLGFPRIPAPEVVVERAELVWTEVPA